MKKLLFSLAMLVGLASFAQPSYTLSTYQIPYTPIASPTVISSSDDGWDDPIFIVPFGFDFQMNGQTYSSAFQFGSGAMMAFGSLNMADTTLTDSVLNVFGLFDDLIDGSYVEGLPDSEISYAIANNPGNRVAVIQYKDAAFFNELDSTATADNRINFQLWFYEDGGIMEIHFGPSNIPDPELIYDGSTGPLVAVILGLNFMSDDMGYAGIITGDPTNPTLFEDFTEESDSLFVLSSTPPTKRVYRLTPSGTTGIASKDLPQFTVYPTLANNEIWVKSGLTSEAKYRIVDITGKQVQSGRMQIANCLNISGLKPGLYLLSINGMGNAVKFIKK